jgi:outer membrane protein insertion porin family
MASLLSMLALPSWAQSETSAPASTGTVSVSTAAPAPVAASSAAASLPVPEETPTPGRPWVLGEIAVEGNKNVKFRVVRDQIKAKKGDLYDRPDLDRDLASIRGLGDFERVAADLTLTDKPVPEHFRAISGSGMTVKLTIVVKERPRIKKIEYKGQKKVSKGALEDATGLRAKDPFDSIKLAEDTDKILAKYREKGFLDAQVTSTFTVDGATLQALVTHIIVEGPKSRIKLVTIDGIKAFKPKKILKQMKKNRRKKVFVEKELPEDIKLIETYYLNRGHLDVTLTTPTVTVTSGTDIYIRFAVDEGRSYRFGETAFGGYSVFVSSALEKTIEYRKGKIFNQEKYEETVRGIQELYAEHGRLRTRITPTKIHNPQTDLMDVTFSIEEGGVVYVDHVDVDGNKATKNHVLKREVVIKPGDAFRRSRVIKSRDKIMNLGFIDDVEIDVQSPEDPSKADVVFDVVEGKPGILTAGAAYSSLDGLIGTLSLQHLNLFGRAQRGSVQWSFGNRVQDYSVGWTTPWVGNSPTSLGFDLFNTRRIMPFDNSLSAYTQKRTGGSVRVGPRFEEDKYQLNFTYTLSRIKLANVQQQFKGTLLEGTSLYSALGVEGARDTRDSIWDPTRGTRNSLGLELSGGPLQGDIHFWKMSMSNSAHFHIFSVAEWPFVLSFSNRAGYVTQFGETNEVPVFDRFFVGGQDTLRGYQPSGEVGYPSGGKVYDVANVEFGFPLARERKRTIVKFVTFFDAGTAWDRVRDISGRVGTGVRDIKTNAGFGIRFTTPAFPIRLDWGYGFNHRPGEKLYQINFGLGQLF